MTNRSVVIALALAFLAFILSVLPVTTASSQPSVDRKVACESKGHKYNPDTGGCIKIIGKTKPRTSGGVGGESTDCGPGYRYDPQRGCVGLSTNSCCGHSPSGGGGGMH